MEKQLVGGLLDRSQHASFMSSARLIRAYEEKNLPAGHNLRSLGMLVENHEYKYRLLNWCLGNDLFTGVFMISGVGLAVTCLNALGLLESDSLITILVIFVMALISLICYYPTAQFLRSKIWDPEVEKAKEMLEAFLKNFWILGGVSRGSGRILSENSIRDHLVSKAIAVLRGEEFYDQVRVRKDRPVREMKMACGSLERYESEFQKNTRGG